MAGQALLLLDERLMEALDNMNRYLDAEWLRGLHRLMDWSEEEHFSSVESLAIECKNTMENLADFRQAHEKLQSEIRTTQSQGRFLQSHPNPCISAWRRLIECAGTNPSVIDLCQLLQQNRKELEMDAYEGTKPAIS